MISIVLGRGKPAALAPLIGIVVATPVRKAMDAEVETVASSSGPIAVGLPPLAVPDLGLISPTLVASAAALTIVVLVQAAGLIPRPPLRHLARRGRRVVPGVGPGTGRRNPGLQFLFEVTELKVWR